MSDKKRVFWTKSDQVDDVWIAEMHILIQTPNGNRVMPLVMRIDAREMPIRLDRAGWFGWEAIDPPGGFTSRAEAAKYATWYATAADEQMTFHPRVTIMQEPRRGVSRTNRKKK